LLGKKILLSNIASTLFYIKEYLKSLYFYYFSGLQEIVAFAMNNAFDYSGQSASLEIVLIDSSEKIAKFTSFQNASLGLPS